MDIDLSEIDFAEDRRDMDRYGLTLTGWDLVAQLAAQNDDEDPMLAVQLDRAARHERQAQAHRAIAANAIRSILTAIHAVARNMPLDGKADYQAIGRIMGLAQSAEPYLRDVQQP